MIRPYTALPTVDVDGKRLRAIGILKTVEEAVAAEGDCVRLRFANSADLVVLGGARHVRDWQQHEARFGKDVMTLPSSAPLAACCWEMRSRLPRTATNGAGSENSPCRRSTRSVRRCSAP